VSVRTINETDWLGPASAGPEPKPGGRPAIDHRGRQRKLSCPLCGFIAYATAGALTRAGVPVCGCGEPMVLAKVRDRAYVEWDNLEAELQALGRDAYNAAMRELGFTDMIERRTDRRGGAVQKRCEAHGCHRFTGGRYCREHEQHRPALSALRKGRAA